MGESQTEARPGNARVRVSGQQPGGADPGLDADVVVVGGGVAGSLTATLLGRAGYRVELVDLHPVAPDEFRVEKVAGDQLEALARLGLLDALAAASTLVNPIVNADRGRLLDISRSDHFSFSYRVLVELVRAAIPDSVAVTFGRVQDVETGPDRQVVTLSSGRRMTCRLVVLATGQATGIRERLGFERRTLIEGGTLAFGFDLVPAGPQPFPFRGLTYYGEHGRGGVDYLALLQQGDVLRGNLFAFGDPRQDWIGAIRRDPDRALSELLPGLGRVLGDYAVVNGRVSMFVMRVVGVDEPERDGIILVGDSFRTSCPAAGTGMSRLLVDVERLCEHHVPRWLATPGMGRDKIAEFYADPLKRQNDARALEVARLRRGVTLQLHLGWKLRRGASFLKRRLRAALKPGEMRRFRAAAGGSKRTPASA